MSRVIFHIDVNNAFLSWTAVDLLNKGYRMDIRKIPSIIGGDESKRHGIVLAKSPVAKKYGIKTAETIYMAKKKCQNLKIFPPNYSLYKEKSNQLFSYLKQFSPNMEIFSIDECFLDMSNTTYLYKDLKQLAYTMKEYIKTHFGFTVNIGIGNNKLCAKMASDFEKPDKVHTLFQEEVASKMWPLPVEDLFMIGKSSAKKLHELGIKTISDLAHADLSKLQKHFKNNAIVMIRHANGIDDSEVTDGKYQTKNKNISVSKTLSTDTVDIEFIKKVLLQEAEEVGRSLRKQNEYAKTIAITIRNKDFFDYSHQTKLKNQTNETKVIYEVALDLFLKTWKRDYIRNIGIRLSDFVEDSHYQISLFESEEKIQSKSVDQTIDKIKDKYGFDSIIPASLLTSSVDKSKNTR